MNTRLKTLLLFVAIAVAGHVGLSIAYTRTVAANHRVTQVDRDFFLAPIDTRILVVGDSMARYGIDEALIGHTSNIAVPGEHIIQTYYRVRQLLDQRPDMNIRVAVIPLGPHSLAEHRSRLFDPSAVWVRYIDPWEAARLTGRPLDFLQLWTEGRFAPYVGQLDTFEQYMIQNRYFKHREKRVGNFSEHPPNVRERKARFKLKFVFGEPAKNQALVDESMLLYFHKLVDLFQSRGIEVVTVTYPVAKEYFRIAKRVGAVEQVRMRLLKPLKEEKGVTHLDYHAIFVNCPECLADSDHVNIKGSKELTATLRAQMIKMGVLP